MQGERRASSALNKLLPLVEVDQEGTHAAGSCSNYRLHRHCVWLKHSTPSSAVVTYLWGSDLVHCRPRTKENGVWLVENWLVGFINQKGQIESDKAFCFQVFLEPAIKNSQGLGCFQLTWSKILSSGHWIKYSILVSKTVSLILYFANFYLKGKPDLAKWQGEANCFWSSGFNSREKLFSPNLNQFMLFALLSYFLVLQGWSCYIQGPCFCFFCNIVYQFKRTDQILSH